MNGEPVEKGVAMDLQPPLADQQSPLAIQLHRRRLLLATGGALAVLGFAPKVALAAQTATPSADQRAMNQLIDLSRALCGGGTFDPGRAEMLLDLFSADKALQGGLDTLLAEPFSQSAATPVTERSPGARAAAEAILMFWYAGVFKDAPVADRSAVYAQLQAWQAMYTPAWTTCKLYGGWADPPSLTPQSPENP